ncbi:MAG: methyltransferase domain-containing protein [Gammaproteobacteria bacterium]|nr:methyltransferase domain-containing protein [Gammaproteobacteria bacterium]
MASIAPVNFDSAFLREQVRATYDQVARNPHGDYHFHRGPQYAQTHLGYNAEELAQLPEECTARFAGVGNPIRIGESAPDIVGIRPGETVLDHACGAGMDLLLAARRVGPTGHAIGVDMTPAMRECATAAAELAGMSRIVDIREGFFEDLPVADESVDVVISNGVVNLAPDKVQVFREIHRVLKPGGRLFMADVVVQRELTLDARCDPTLWAACVGGAMVENEVSEIAAEVGLSGGRVVQRFNCFYNTTAEAKVAKDLFVHAVNFYAGKPDFRHGG